MVQWVLAVSSAMLLAGLVEYGVARQQIVDRALQDSLRGYQAMAEGLEEALVSAAPPAAQAELIEREIEHLRHSYGTEYVGLFDAAGQLVASSGAGEGAIAETGPELLDDVLATKQATVQTEADEGEDEQHGRYEFLLPMSSSEGMLVLEIDQRADIITELVDDLRLRKFLGLLLAVLIAIPLSYVLGGRDLHRRQLLARRDADADPLTGLAGRRPFHPALAAALTHRTDAAVTLALLDLDDFKQINDRLGHSHGDRVLNGLAAVLGHLGESDTAFRLGGDEFAVIMRGGPPDRGVGTLERIRAALAGQFAGATFSAGIASSTAADAVDSRELWERADAALFEAKRLGRRQSVTFESMAEGHSVSAEKIGSLTALVAGESPITVAFQPIWDLRRGVVLAHESLLRLPQGSPIKGPQEAFDLAERLGLAPALDARARDAVLAAVRDRRWEGLLFLNIHPHALPGLDLDSLTAGLATAGLEPADVVLEVTEQAGLDHPEPIRTLARAKERGFRLALDDMGRSNAGLRALTLVRFDIVKIDGDVISRLGTDPSSAATVAAAMTFVERTGGWVVAEGIEDETMITALLNPGYPGAARKSVLAGQGFLLGRPDKEPVGINTHLPVLDYRRGGTTADEPDPDRTG